MTKDELDALSVNELLEFKELTLEGFDKDRWKSVWLQAVEYWWEDSGAWYDYVINGFKGWSERSAFEIYMDLRFTYIEGQDMTWDKLAAENDELGKYS